MTASHHNSASGPDIRAVAPLAEGWWHTMSYSEPGMRVPFDAVNGVSVDRAIDTPTYAIDATTDEHSAEGLYVITSGCLVDVEALSRQLEGAYAQGGRRAEQVPMLDLVKSGAILPLTEKAAFRLPSQEIGGPLTLSYNGGRIRPTGRAGMIRSIEADLMPYGVHTSVQAARFAARLGIHASGIVKEGDAASAQGDLSGRTPLMRAAKRLNYALTPVEVQASARRPHNKDEVIDGLRTFVATKLQESP